MYRSRSRPTNSKADARSVSLRDRNIGVPTSVLPAVKTNNAILLLILVVFVLALAGPATAQKSQDEDVISLDADLVTVDLTVTNAKGEFVPDLKPDEVKLYEDGQPRACDFFAPSTQTGPNRALAVVLSLDISGSITKEEVELQRQAVSKFVTLVRPESLFSVITFNHEIKVLEKFTSDPKKIGKAFGKAVDMGGSTRLFDSIDQAFTMLRKAPVSRGGRRLRRVVVVITDGYDSSSVISTKELLRRAASDGVTVYSITLPSYQRQITGERFRVLTLLDASRIVPLTGGIDFSADSSDYTPFFQAIAQEVSASYQVAFYPSDEHRRDGKFHQLRIEVTRPGVTVRTNRTGYQVESGR